MAVTLSLSRGLEVLWSCSRGSARPGLEAGGAEVEAVALYLSELPGHPPHTGHGPAVTKVGYQQLAGEEEEEEEEEENEN